MDFYNRQYDPQLGRFMGIDPMADAAGQQGLSPYHAMACNPSIMVDPFGLEPKYGSYTGSVPDVNMEILLRYPTMPNFLKGIYDYGEYSGNKMLENRELQRLIERNIDAYLATVGGEGARYYGGQAQVMFGRFQAGRRQSYPGSNAPSLGNLPADGTEMGGVGTEITQNSEELPEVTVQFDISWAGAFSHGPVSYGPGAKAIAKFVNGFMNASKSDMKSPSALIGYEGLMLGKTELIVKAQYVVASAASKASFTSSITMLEKGGKYLGWGGAVVGFVESATDENGFTTGDLVKLGINILTIYGGPVGLIYGALDVTVGLATGSTITDRIGAGIDNAIK